MEKTRFLVIGAGVTGLSFANWLDSDDYLVLEALPEIGGYCRTIREAGFVWDFSGHFFHFKHPEIERYLVERMGDQEVRTVEKQARIYYRGQLVDFPFQKNIHQLPKDELVECLVDLYFKPEHQPQNFHEMVVGRFGKGIADRFLIPYNEKLYATDLRRLDVDAMGRFFPYADLDQIIGNMREPDNRSYNATFTYPAGGAIQYVNALASGVDRDRIALEEAVTHIDLRAKVARTSRGREIAFEAAVSSVPFNRLLAMTELAHDASIYTWNKVLVFNLGFDRKGPDGIHWLYFPDRELCFYRVGFYDNILDGDRMSLYVEIGYPRDAQLGEDEVTAMRQQVLDDLRSCGIVEDHRLVAWHSVVLDPAYVHITQASLADVATKRRILETRNVYSLGRYGAWTYCAIEDNIVEARDLAEAFNAVGLGA